MGEIEKKNKARKRKKSKGAVKLSSTNELRCIWRTGLPVGGGGTPHCGVMLHFENFSYLSFFHGCVSQGGCLHKPPSEQMEGNVHILILVWQRYIFPSLI